MGRITVNIGEPQGQAAVGATWRYAEGYVPGEDNEGLVARTEGSPARLADYDDSGWDVVKNLPDRISEGFSFMWYRTTITIPETLDGLTTRGMRVQFETCVDDYAEIWIDGEWNRDRGAIQGFNTPQRVMVSGEAQPGDKHTIAVLAINGPLAQPFGAIHMRYANLGFEWSGD